MPEIQPLRPGDPTSVDQYRIVGRIGEGGQGTVYLGVDAEGRQAAIKIMTSVNADDMESRLRFQREIEVASKVASFCTVRVLGHGISDDRLYMVSEYIPGESLQQHVLARGPLDAFALTRLAVNTSTALISIHNTGIVHRDFKPSNVLLGPDGPYVIDFGVARAFGDRTVTVTGVLGTPAYMSPEQLSGDRVAPASDMFSWALTMVFAALGRPLFGDSTIAAMAITLRRQEIDLSGIGEPLRSIIASCLADRPGSRPTARQVLNSLIVPSASPEPGDQPPPWPAERQAPALSAPPGKPSPFAPPDAPYAPPDRPYVSPETYASVYSFTPPGSFSASGQPFRPPGGPSSSPFEPSGQSPGTLPPDSGPVSRPAAAAPARRSRRRLALIGAVLAMLAAAGTVPVARWLTTPAPPGPVPVAAAFGTPIGWQPTGHFAAITAVGTAEVAGRPITVTASEDGTLRRWDARTARPIGAPMTGHGDWVRAMATTTVNGRPVAITGGDDKTVRVWDLTTGQASGAPLTGHTGAVLAVATTTVKGEPVAVSAGKDRVLRSWHLKTGRPALAPRAGHTDWVRALTVIPDALPANADMANTIVSAADDRTVRIWDLASDRVKVIRGLPDAMVSLAAIRTGASWTLLGAGRDGVIRGWDGAGKPVGTALAGHTGQIMAVTTATVDGAPRAFSGGADKSVRTWDLTTWTASAMAPGHPGHSAGVRAVALATVRGTPVAVSGGADRTVRMSAPATGALIGTPLLGHDDQITAMATGSVAGAPVAVSGDAAGGLRMWRLDTGAALGKPLAGHRGSVNAVTFSGDVVVSGGADGRLHRWNATTGAPVGPPLAGHRKAIRALAAATVGGRPVVISASEDHELRLWDVAAGKQIGAPLTGHEGAVLAVATTVIGGRPLAVSAGEDRLLHRWDLITGTAVGPPLSGHTDWVRALAASGERVVSAGDDRSLRVWNLRTGEAVGRPIRGHTGPVYALATGQVGGTAAAISAGTDWTVRAWSLHGG